MKLATEMELGSYVLKIADNHREVAQAIQLRSRVFRDDFGAECDPEDDYWDWSEMDDRASHLIVQSRETRQVVGTYRLILSDAEHGFYSQSEFELGGLLSRPGLKLELSRACVDPSARTGAVMALLWKGLAESVRVSGASYLFGCSSLLTEDFEEVRPVLGGLVAAGFTCPDYGISVLPEYKMESAEIDVVVEPGAGEVSNSETPGLPALLRLYLKAGAKVAPVPAHDRAFRCVDLLTVLDVDRMNPVLARKYGLAG